MPSRFRRREVFVLCATLAVWGLLLWWFGRPPRLTADFLGWRQADTQTMALFQAETGSSVLLPRIAWGGDGPGFVESELPVYAWLTGKLLSWAGPGAEWPGQLLSLLFVGGAGLLLATMLTRRFGSRAGLTSAVLFLSSPGALFLGVSVQPDALALCCLVGAAASFWRYVESGSRAALAITTGATLLATLNKPPALHLGLSMFVWLLLERRQRLRDPALWVGWALVLVGLGAYLWHAHSLFEQYGNSFGVLGGDRKFPTWQSLTSPGLYLSILRVTVGWGPGPFGLAALGLLGVLGEARGRDWALWFGFGISLVVAQRYTSHSAWGAHYHVYGLLPGMVAWASWVRVAEARWPRWANRGLLAWGLLAALYYGVNLHSRHQLRTESAPYVDVVERTRRWIGAGSRLIVRSSQPARSGTFWGGGPLNFEDPRPFYVTGATGWVLPSDARGAEAIVPLVARGAEFYLEPTPTLRRDADFERWLDRHARLLLEVDGARLFSLPPASAPR